jgi:hypothetical protein
MGALDETTKEIEDRRDPAWRTRTGAPRKWLIYDGDSILTSPIAPGVTFTVGYIESPTAMALDGDFPDSRIVDAHHQHLPLAALYLLLTKDGDQMDIQKANKCLQDFMQFIVGGKS